MATVVTVGVNHPHKGANAAGPKHGLIANVSKAEEQRVKVREHLRGKPTVTVPVKREAMAMSYGGDTREEERANIEGNESARYEAMEKKSLKGLKGGGTEQELREGHNTKKKWIAGAIKHPGALHAQLHVPQGKKIPAKKMAAAKAGKYGATAAKRANLAKTLGAFKKK
jgi:hypothetical protein